MRKLESILEHGDNQIEENEHSKYNEDSQHERQKIWSHRRNFSYNGCFSRGSSSISFIDSFYISSSYVCVKNFPIKNFLINSTVQYKHFSENIYTVSTYNVQDIPVCMHTVCKLVKVVLAEHRPVGAH